MQQKFQYDQMVMEKKCNLKRQKGLGDIHGNGSRGQKGDNGNKRAKYGDNGADVPPFSANGNMPPQMHDQQ